MSTNDSIAQLAADKDFTFRGPTTATAIGGSEQARSFAQQMLQEVAVLSGPAQQAALGALPGIALGDPMIGAAGAIAGAVNGMFSGKGKGRSV